MYGLLLIPSPLSALKWVKTNLVLALSVATDGMRIISTKTPINLSVPISTRKTKAFCPKDRTGKFFIPKTFQIAPSCPKNDNIEIGRLFIIPWRSKIPPWKARTTYLDATYPPPFFPPVLRRMMTWMSCASEKSTLVVPAHWKCKQNYSLKYDY